MITSSSISYISQMLEEPQNIHEADAESIKALTDTYPYFVPARYMQAAQQHKAEPYTPDMMSSMQLFSGNWLQYCEYLKEALNGEDAEFGQEAKPAVSEMEVAQPVVEELPVTVPEVVQQQQAPEPEPQPQPEIPAEPVVAIAPETEPAIETATQTEFIEIEQEIPEENFGNLKTGFIRGKKNTAEPVEAKQPETEKPKAGNQSQSFKESTAFKRRTEWDNQDDNLIPPIYTEDYFLHQGMNVSNDIPEDIIKHDQVKPTQDEPKSLMVMMSFAEWLSYYKKKRQEEQEEQQDQKDLKTMWQKEKLAAAMEEENEEIPEGVFEMAVNSITKEENLVSESLAEVLVKQGRYDRAIDMYKKLSLRKPQKKAYFARKIEEILKEK